MNPDTAPSPCVRHEEVSGHQLLLTVVLRVHWLVILVYGRDDSKCFLLCAATTFLHIKNCKSKVYREKYRLFLNCRI